MKPVEQASVLERILQSTRAGLRARQEALPLEQLRERTEQTPRGAIERERRFHGALSAPGIGVIAEFKRRSPSAGAIRQEPDLRELIGAYERGGASAISVLTEGPHFAGSLEDLHAARAACDLPLLRKDFIVDPYQLYEALLAGADAILLIVAALAQGELASLHAQARALDLDVLVEVHDRDELQRALALEGADLIGINNRDLRDFSVDVQRTFDLLAGIPAGVTVVSESGISAPEQLRELDERGVGAVLVGEALMRAPDPQVALRELRSAERVSFRDSKSRL
ncbi:MAG TPA: indole-3-glycerol phosphate synthase TrpC [Solirubrobacteraceae bacterium]|jgi:indole-3-glycerol phosphate synthase